MTDLDPVEAAARLLLPALRLDVDSVAAVRRDAERALEMGVGGFVLFGGEADRVAELTRELRRAAARPLWMASDLERGAGQQFEGAVQCPPPAALARAPDPEEAARTAGRITGLEARRLGVDWALAPVLDLDVEPDNPIVSTRSFGADPEHVARLGTAWIEGCQGVGVAACAKHYPGHGRTTSDSHLELPLVGASAETLRREDLAPFRAAAPRVASVMTAHVAYPDLEDGSGEKAPTPATYSRRLVTGLLRDELGFGGAVVTDALTMAGAGSDDRGAGDLAARALRAGCDLMLYPGDLEAAVDGLARRMGNGDGQDLARHVRRARQRKREVKKRFVAGTGSVAVPAVEGREHEPGGPSREALERDALDLAVSCVTAAPGAGEPGADLDPERSVQVAPVSDDPERVGEPEPFGDAFARELASLGWRAGRAPAGGDGPGPDQRVVLLRSTPQAEKGRAAPADERLAEVRRLLDGVSASALVVFGHERALRDADRPGLCAWSAEALMQRAAARALDGRARTA